MGRGIVSRGGQVDALTGLRGLAAWFVVLYHIRTAFAPSVRAEITAIFAKGYLAVDLFFVLSGFVLWMTWGQRLARGGAVRSFLQKRLARVWPLHGVILTATVAYALALQASGRPTPASFDWAELPLHVLLVQNWGLTREIGWKDPSWSISTEVAAYLIFAAVAPLIARASGWALPVLAATVLIIALDRAFAWGGHDTLGADIAGMGLVRCLAQFGCGVAACMVWQRCDGRALTWVAAVIAAASAIAWVGGGRETLVVPTLFTALVIVVAATSSAPANPLASRLAVWLGEISYSTYLVHFLLWKLYKHAVVRDADDVPLLVVGGYLALTLLASVVLYRLVEVPARDRLGRLPVRPGNPVAA